MAKTIKNLLISLVVMVVLLLGNIFLNGPVELSAILSLIGGFLIAAICYGRTLVDRTKK